MDWVDVFKLITAAIASVGVAGAVIFSLSSWLGKVWASRILDRERNSLNKELEETKRDFDIYKDKYLRNHNDKIVVYRAVIDIVSKILAYFDSIQPDRPQPQDAAKALDLFNEQRMQAYGYLAMLAPQKAMDAHDRLIDHLIMISNGSSAYEWKEVRDLAIAFINEVRIDVGIDKDPITYNGEL